MDARTLLTLSLAAALLGGCAREPERSYEWYMEHRDAAMAKAKECSEMALAEAAADGNCARAQKAIGTARSVKYRPGSVVGR